MIFEVVKVAGIRAIQLISLVNLIVVDLVFSGSSRLPLSVEELTGCESPRE